MLSINLTAGLLAVFLIFCRIGSAFMLIPVVSESYIPSFIRLNFAIIVSIAIAPTLYFTVQGLSNLPNTHEIFFIIIAEIITGLIIGTISKIIISAVHTAGVTISSHMGISIASLFDPSQHSQGSNIGSLLTLFITATIVSLDLHLILIKGIIDSYHTIPLASIFNYNEDYSKIITEAVNAAWFAGIKMSTPIIIVTLIILIGAGILSKLMPQIQIFYLFMPLQILIGIVILAFSVSTMLNWFIDYFQDNVQYLLFR